MSNKVTPKTETKTIGFTLELTVTEATLLRDLLGLTEADSIFEFDRLYDGLTKEVTKIIGIDAPRTKFRDQDGRFLYGIRMS